MSIENGTDWIILYRTLEDHSFDDGTFVYHIQDDKIEREFENWLDEYEEDQK